MKKLIDAIETALRAAKVPGHISARVLSHVESSLNEYGVKSLEEIFKAPDWYLWLIVIKSILSPITKILKSEGYCHANYYVIGSLIALDERLHNLIKEWVKVRCRAGNDPCCSNPKCCLVA